MRSIFIKALIIIITYSFLFGYLRNTLIFDLVSNIIIIISFFLIVFPIMNNNEINEYKSDSSEKDENLYKWSNNLGGEYSILSYMFSEEKTSKNVLENMENIEKSIMGLAKYETKNLRLIRAYIKTVNQKKAETIYFNTIGGFLISFLIFIAKSLFDKENNRSLIFQFTLEKSWGFIIAFGFYAIYFLLYTHRGENMKNLALNLLDEMISEREIKNDR